MAIEIKGMGIAISLSLSPLFFLVAINPHSSPRKEKERQWG